jgi:ABC-2 type transport system permease protein
VSIIASMLPAIMLSGFLFQIRSMPPALQAITYLVPARYYIVILRGVILKGASLAPYWQELAALVAFALVMTTLASVRLARRER